MLDSGLILYLSLLVLLAWRLISGWRCCGKWLEYVNYCVLLYTLLLFLLVYAVVWFGKAALSNSGKNGWDQLPTWMRFLVIGAPFAVFVAFGICVLQTGEHVMKIRKNEAGCFHDRAVQIILLPAVYGTMSMSSLTRLYQLVAQDFSSDGATDAEIEAYEASEDLALAKSETCFYVADLYEAWALYQFGQLTLELIRNSIKKMSDTTNQNERDKADALLVAHNAVESLAWLGVTLFLVVCVLQAGWSLYLLTFTSPWDDWDSYNEMMYNFKAAGYVASCAAIWNVHIVESKFHCHLEQYRPFLKFITVKVIVSIAFLQKGVLYILEAIQSTLPSAAQTLCTKVPIFGDILAFSDNEFELFYSAVILYECVFIALLHWWAWSAEEEWYAEEDTEEKGAGEDSERRPLLAHSSPMSSGGRSSDTP